MGVSPLRRRADSSARDTAIALPSENVNEGVSPGSTEVASVVTVRMVPNLFCPVLVLLCTSSKLEKAVVSVMVEACDCRIGEAAIESAIDARTESPTDARVESATDARSTLGRGRRGDRGGGDMIGGTVSNSRSLSPPWCACPLLTVLSPAELPDPEPSSAGLAERSVGSGCGGLQRFLPVGECGPIGEVERCICASVRFGVEAAPRELLPPLYGLCPAPPWIYLDFSGGNSACRCKARTVRATWAKDSALAMVRSSRPNSASDGTPTEVQAARKRVTLDERATPSSLGSTREIVPGKSLFMSLSNDRLIVTRRADKR